MPASPFFVYPATEAVRDLASLFFYYINFAKGACPEPTEEDLLVSSEERKTRWNIARAIVRTTEKELAKVSSPADLSDVYPSLDLDKIVKLPCDHQFDNGHNLHDFQSVHKFVADFTPLAREMFGDDGKPKTYSPRSMADFARMALPIRQQALKDGDWPRSNGASSPLVRLLPTLMSKLDEGIDCETALESLFSLKDETSDGVQLEFAGDVVLSYVCSIVLYTEVLDDSSRAQSVVKMINDIADLSARVQLDSLRDWAFAYGTGYEP